VNDDIALVDRLRRGDEAACAELVRRYHSRLVRLATDVVGRRDIAEEVTQDTWLSVLRGIARFEGRSSFKTWLFHILINLARTAMEHETRAGRPQGGVEERSQTAAWVDDPADWSDAIEDRIVAERVAPRVRELLPLLPNAQRTVVTLRDIEGVSAADVGTLLHISAANQRVILHRGHARLRKLLADQLSTA
jgi:RNA polymerase sigma-70 factor (ECF subfamily)